MALTYRFFYMNCQSLRSIIKPVKWSVEKNNPIRISGSTTCFKSYLHTSKPENQSGPVSTSAARKNAIISENVMKATSVAQNPRDCPPEKQSPEEKPTLFQRLKMMYKNYWYVVVPVHLVTSACWFGGFYYAVRSGLDVVSILESLGVSETLIIPLRDSKAGYVALTLAIYKVVTPLRYAVTLGLTTFAIKRLTGLGLIKPVPSTERIKEMIQEKKDNFQDRKQHYQEQMKEKRNSMMDEMRRYKEEVKKKVQKK